MVTLISLEEFVLEYRLYLIIAASILAALVITLTILLLVKRNKKGQGKANAKPVSKSAYMEALGGEDNILEHTRKGSRIELKLKDYEALDKEKIKEAGVDGFIKMSDRLTLVIKGNAETVENTLFGTNED